MELVIRELQGDDDLEKLTNLVDLHRSLPHLCIQN